MDNITKDLVEILRSNARLSNDEIAAMLGTDVADVRARIAKLESSGIIIGYSAIINEEKYNPNVVRAFIELSVSPKTESGYNVVADAVANIDEVDTVQLMSGTFDLAVTIRGTNLRDIAMFVADKLAPLDGILSTTTHFVLERYKEKGVLFAGDGKDEREMLV